MSVVRTGRRRRWAAVALGTGVLLATPAAWSAVGSLADGSPADGSPADGRRSGTPAQFAQRVLASADVAHHGLVESRGGISLPDLPRLGQVSPLLGGSVRARVWWTTPAAWRVDALSATGEHGTYGRAGELVTWDYEDDVLRTGPEQDGLRLPRVDDLLPPQAARRLLAGVGGADRVEWRSAPARLAGRQAWGLRIRPADARSTLASVEIWADARTGLPLSVTVRGADGVVALTTRFLDVALEAARPGVVTPPSPPAARRTSGDRLDLLELSERSGPWSRPSALAGFRRAPSAAVQGDGVAMYGEGLTRFVVLQLPAGLGARVQDAVRRGGAVPSSVAGGEISQLRSGVLGLVLATGTDSGQSYLLSGPVRGEALAEAAAALLVRPGERR